MSEPRCCVSVYDRTTWSKPPCGSRVKYQHEGRWYCRRHYPPAVRARKNPMTIEAFFDLLSVVEEAIERYGKPGGPWNVPSDPGGWMDRAQAAVAKARGGER
jgi:hypothetical protein